MSARRGFVEQLTRHLARALGHALEAEALATRAGLLQRLDPRVKLVGALALIVSVVLTHTLGAVVVVFALALLLARASRIEAIALFGPLWLSVLLFTGAIALPALVVVPGDALGSCH